MFYLREQINGEIDIMKFDTRQLGTAFALLFFGTLINAVPLFYDGLDVMLLSQENNMKFLDWLMANPDVYFVLLSTVIMSFMEYLLTTECKRKGLIYFNFVYVVIILVIWAYLVLKKDYIVNLVANKAFMVCFAVLVTMAFAFCAFNLIAMNQRSSVNKDSLYASKRII